MNKIISNVLEFCQNDRNYLNQIIEQLKDVYEGDDNWGE